ncbi:MAG: DNA polymerase/3'-5' exonuclease PolX [Chthoniobacterales bacterium]|nr:DNA polymerase/3'-5' exonuclease PolX [Chthoniobacterales bacterium]
MPSVTRDQVIDILERIALLLELQGENPFKVRAYRNGARALELLEGDLSTLVRDTALEGIPGIGEALREKIGTLVTTGHLPYYEELRAQFPPKLFELFEVPGLGPKKIKALYENLKVASLADLEKACESGKVAGLEGFGAKTEEKLLSAIDSMKQGAGLHLASVAAHASQIIYHDLRALPEVIRISVGGSTRRRNEIVHDIDLIVSTKDPAAVSRAFRGHPLVEKVLAAGDTKSSTMLKSGIQADLRVVSDEEFPFAQNYFTGSKEHNIRLRGLAQDRGWTLNEYRLAPAEKGAPKIPRIRDERDLYELFGFDYIEPELRENRGEFEAAAEHKLPDLVTLEQIRGTFHCHTRASDGRNTLAEMATAAQDLGLQYLGIADHSKASFQANGLDAARLEKQIAEIKALNKEFDGFRLFAGTECDILKDGELDFPDPVLEQLDYVVASVHSSFTLPEAEMTKRLIRAMENRHVTMLGHLTGRLLLKREAYAVNIPEILEAAAATGTMIEINADPHRLEMDWRWWRLAKEKGVNCVINPDAHSIEGLQSLYFGIGTARKGWLTKNDIVNCLPLAKVVPVLGAKREGKKP